MTDISPAEWQRGADRPLLDTRVFRVRASEFRHPSRPDGREFIVIDAPDWAVVAAVTTKGELVLVRQFRFGAERLSLELPGGVVEPGEDPLAGAVRELAEETGFRGGKPILLGSVYPNPAIQSNRAHLILIPDAVQVEATAWDPDEELGMRLEPVDQVLALARAGGISHALMLNALFLLEPWWSERQRTQADGAGV